MLSFISVQPRSLAPDFRQIAAPAGPIFTQEVWMLDISGCRASRATECMSTASRNVGPERAMRALAGDRLSLEVALTRAERVLSGTLGAASARIIVAAYGRRGRLLPRSARALIDEASEQALVEELRAEVDAAFAEAAASVQPGAEGIFDHVYARAPARLDAGARSREDFRDGLLAVFLAPLLAADEKRRSAVVHAGSIACGDYASFKQWF